MYRRRRIAVGGIAGLILLSVTLLTAFVWPGFADRPTATPTEATTTAQPPMPTITPAPRVGEQTALVAALPDRVHGFVQSEIIGLASDDAAQDALESWRVNYRDGDTPGANSIVVEVHQFAADTAAESFLAAQTSDFAEPLAHGDVLVGEIPTGLYALFADAGDTELAVTGETGASTPAVDANSTTPGVLIWRNGTVVITARGPINLMPQFYTGFPL